MSAPPSDSVLTSERVLFASPGVRGERIRIISARKSTRMEGSQYAKRIGETTKDELRPEYDLSQLGGGVRGKYYRQAEAGTNLVLIEPDLAKAFPDQESVNRALRLLVTTASAARRGSRRPRKARKR